MNKKAYPPKKALNFLLGFMDQEEQESFKEYVSSVYGELLSKKDLKAARCWFWSQFIRSLPGLVITSMQGSLSMLLNYLKVAVRNMTRKKLMTFINVSGLMLGISCCLLAVLYVSDELSYDRFHENQDTLFRITRVLYDNSDGSIRHRDPDMVPAMAEDLTEFFTDIKYQTLFAPSTGVVRYQDKIFRERIHLVNASFFQMFSFPLFKGSPESVLSSRDAVVLSQGCAVKYFGNRDPVGKTIQVTFGKETRDFIVTGVSGDPPENSSIQFEILIHISNLPWAYGQPDLLQTYAAGWWGTPIFVQLKEGVSAARVEQRFHPFTRKYFASNIERWKAKGWSREGNPFSFYLQPIKDIYLDVGVYHGRGMASIYILMGIAVMVLLIACINFTNLSLGLSSTRSNEIGIRKVIGAEKKQLVFQFWGESLMMTFVAFGGGILLTLLLLPTFNSLSGKMLNADALLKMQNLASVAVLMVVTGFLAGSYPAFIMAGFQPVEIMKRRLVHGMKSGVTKALVVFQFVLSVSLVLSTMLLSDQLYFLINKDLGYEKKGLVAVRTQERTFQESQRLLTTFRNRIAIYPDIKAVSACNAPFGLDRYPRSSNPEGIDCHYNMVDSLFAGTLDLHVTEGRDFIQNADNPPNEALVNQSFINALGLELESGILIDQEIIDKLGIPDYLNQTQIVGVLEDFHFSVLSHEIFPAIFHLRPVSPFTRILVKIDTKNIPSTMRHLEEAWKEVQPDKPFVHYFQDDALENLYQSQKRWSAIIRYVSVLAIFIACLGIFGLTVNMINRRTKEIGIRKVLGAGIYRVMYLIMKEYMILVALANVIAWPLVWIIMQKVLQNFPYRISIGIKYLLLSAVISMAVAMATVLFLVIKAAAVNPVECLRHE